MYDEIGEKLEENGFRRWNTNEFCGVNGTRLEYHFKQCERDACASPSCQYCLGDASISLLDWYKSMHASNKPGMRNILFPTTQYRLLLWHWFPETLICSKSKPIQKSIDQTTYSFSLPNLILLASQRNFYHQIDFKYVICNSLENNI